MPTVIGLDLGKKSFRAAELEKTRKGVIVHRLGEYESSRLELDLNSDDSIKEYASAINSFIDEMSFSTAQTAVALEEKDVFTRIVQLPQMSDKELKTSINYEAEQYIPISLDEVNLTHQKIDLKGLDTTHINVQLVAARKTVVDKYTQILKKAKLVPIIIEPEAMAIGRSLAKEQEGSKGTLILHIGFSKSILIIMLGENVLFTRTLTIGGDSFTKAVSQNLGIDTVQAEEYKKAYGLDSALGDGRVSEALKPLVNNLVAEMKRSQIFFTSRYAGATINKVLLSGGTALLPGLLLNLTANLDIEVQLSNPFRDMTFHKNLEDKKAAYLQKAPLYSVAVGLALNDF